MMTPTTIRHEIDLKYCIWSHENLEWREEDEEVVFEALRDLQPFDTIEVCSSPRKEDRHGRVLITLVAHGHYEAHGTFSTSWGDVDFIAEELDLDMSVEGMTECLDDLMIYNANGEPGVSRDFHFIESSFELMLLAVDHVESMLLLQDEQEWVRFRGAALVCDGKWRVGHES